MIKAVVKIHYEISKKNRQKQKIKYDSSLEIVVLVGLTSLFKKMPPISLCASTAFVCWEAPYDTFLFSIKP